ncbi:hypothetical protein FISHEDRAFT_51793 [Fistulina hepatica ATCC 64428]|nr:hypothetical protein FISHEDRAFT_51793 [Fistulina hepatica ATCC 64428]
MVTSTAKAEILLVGLGAIGATYAHFLTQSGRVHLTVVARSNYEEVKANGLNFKCLSGGSLAGWRPDRIFRTVAEAADRQYDFVLVATKCVPETAPTPKILASLLSTPYTETYRQPVYVLVQNGMSIEEDLYQSIQELKQGEPKIVTSAVFVFANALPPNIIEPLAAGIYRHREFAAVEPSSEETRFMEELKSLITTGGGRVEICPDIQCRKFLKNMRNIVFSGMSALSRYALGSIFRPPPSESQSYEPYVWPGTADHIKEYTHVNMREAFAEMVALGRALGFPKEEWSTDAHADAAMREASVLFASPAASLKVSTLLDIEKGVPIEIEVIWGSVVRLGAAYKVSMPRVEMMYGLLVVVQNQLLRVTQKL